MENCRRRQNKLVHVHVLLNYYPLNLNYLIINITVTNTKTEERVWGRKKTKKKIKISK
jgi:hypothetical protein